MQEILDDINAYKIKERDNLLQTQVYHERESTPATIENSSANPLMLGMLRASPSIKRPSLLRPL